eukprot:gene12241-13502_t
MVVINQLLTSVARCTRGISGGQFQSLFTIRCFARRFSIRSTSSSPAFLIHGWGSCDGNEFGKSFNATSLLTPVLLNISEDVASVSCGYATTFLTTKSCDKVIGYGLNSVGQLGIMTEGENEINLGGEVKQISCGRAHTILLSSDGVFAAGSNIQGQCGLPKDFHFCEEFQRVLLPFDYNDVKEVACGMDHTLILTKQGQVYSTGLGADGQTGTGKYDCEYGFAEVIGDITNEKVTQVSTTTDICLALTDNNRVYGWGNNEQGQISWQNNEKQVSVPTQVNHFPDGLNEINQVFAGGSFSSLVSDGHVYVTGYGALGLGQETIEAHFYEKVDHCKSELGRVDKISGGPDYIAALTDCGKLLTWGRGNHGRLGHGGTDDQYSPKLIFIRTGTIAGGVSSFAHYHDVTAINHCRAALLSGCKSQSRLVLSIFVTSQRNEDHSDIVFSPQKALKNPYLDEK